MPEPVSLILLNGIARKEAFAVCAGSLLRMQVWQEFCSLWRRFSERFCRIFLVVSPHQTYNKAEMIESKGSRGAGCMHRAEACAGMQSYTFYPGKASGPLWERRLYETVGRKWNLGAFLRRDKRAELQRNHPRLCIFLSAGCRKDGGSLLSG